MKTGTTAYLQAEGMVSAKRSIAYKTKSLFIRSGRKIANTFKKKNTYVELICSLLIILFLYTGINKLMDYTIFKFQIGRSPFLENLKDYIALPLPIGEILIALLLIFNKTRMMGLYLSFLLMLVFTGYIFTMLQFSYYLPCSCGGVLAMLSWHDHLIFNIFFSILALLGTILQTNCQKKESILTKDS